MKKTKLEINLLKIIKYCEFVNFSDQFIYLIKFIYY